MNRENIYNISTKRDFSLLRSNVNKMVPPMVQKIFKCFQIKCITKFNVLFCKVFCFWEGKQCRSQGRDQYFFLLRAVTGREFTQKRLNIVTIGTKIFTYRNTQVGQDKGIVPQKDGYIAQCNGFFIIFTQQ